MLQSTARPDHTLDVGRFLHFTGVSDRREGDGQGCNAGAVIPILFCGGGSRFGQQHHASGSVGGVSPAAGELLLIEDVFIVDHDLSALDFIMDATTEVGVDRSFGVIVISLVFSKDFFSAARLEPNFPINCKGLRVQTLSVSHLHFIQQLQPKHTKE